MLNYAAQEIPQIDTEVAKKGHLWMETNLSQMKEQPWIGVGWKTLEGTESGI